MHMAFTGSLAHTLALVSFNAMESRKSMGRQRGFPLSKPRDDRSQESQDAPAGPLRSRCQETALPSSGVASSCPL